MNDIQLIEAVIQRYFQGTYAADEALLRSAFYPSARICGFVAGGLIDVSVDAFVRRVCDEVQHDRLDKKILSIEICNDIAIVKAKVLVGDVYFTDFIQLIKCDGAWLIRHKAFTEMQTDVAGGE